MTFILSTGQGRLGVGWFLGFYDSFSFRPFALSVGSLLSCGSLLVSVKDI